MSQNPEDFWIFPRANRGTKDGNVVAAGRVAGWEALMDEFEAANALSASSGQVVRNLRAVNDFLWRAGATEPAGITSATVEAYLAEGLRHGRTQKTILNAKHSISRFCSFLVDRGLLPFNPCQRVRCRRAEIVSPPVIWNPARLEAVLAMAQERGIGAAVALAVWGGLRLGELVRLEWRDLDLDGATVVMRRSKSGQPRLVPLCHRAVEALRLHRAAHPQANWVFPARQTWRGGWRWLDRPATTRTLLRRLEPIQDAFAEFRQLAGRRVGRGFHLFRHTFASKKGQAGVTERKIAEWLGHTTLTMAMRYTHLAQGYDPDIEKGV